MNGLVEQLLLASDQENDEGHVDVMVVGLVGAVDSAGVESLQDGDDELLGVAPGQHEVPELVVPVEQQIQQQGGVLSVERLGQGGVEGRVLQSEGCSGVQNFLCRRWLLTLTSQSFLAVISPDALLNEKSASR